MAALGVRPRSGQWPDLLCGGGEPYCRAASDTSPILGFFLLLAALLAGQASARPCTDQRNTQPQQSYTRIAAMLAGQEIPGDSWLRRFKSVSNGPSTGFLIVLNASFNVLDRSHLQASNRGYFATGTIITVSLVATIWTNVAAPDRPTWRDQPGH